MREIHSRFFKICVFHLLSPVGNFLLPFAEFPFVFVLVVQILCFILWTKKFFFFLVDKVIFTFFGNFSKNFCIGIALLFFVIKKHMWKSKKYRFFPAFLVFFYFFSFHPPFLFSVVFFLFLFFWFLWIKAQNAENHTFFSKKYRKQKNFFEFEWKQRSLTNHTSMKWPLDPNNLTAGSQHSFLP